MTEPKKLLDRLIEKRKFYEDKLNKINVRIARLSPKVDPMDFQESTEYKHGDVLCLACEKGKHDECALFCECSHKNENLSD